LSWEISGIWDASWIVWIGCCANGFWSYIKTREKEKTRKSYAFQMQLTNLEQVEDTIY
jgi:hypothetical protein